MHFFLIFGWRHFRLMRLTPAQAGLLGPEYENCLFERRQWFFHLFFIPFFMLGRYWYVRKPDDKIYVLPASAEEHLKAFEKRSVFRLVRANFLVFMGLIFSLGALAIDIASYNYSLERSKEYFNENVAEMDESLKNPSTKHYWHVTIFKGAPGNCEYVYTCFLKVDSITPTHILLGSSDTALFASANISWNYDSTRSSVLIKRADVRGAVKRIFTMSDFDNFSTFWGEFLYMFRSKKDYERFDGTTIDGLPKGHILRLNDIGEQQVKYGEGGYQ
jgi:hypothetical protein